MSSIHLSPFSGPAFILRSARLVNKMIICGSVVWFSTTQIPKIPTLVLFPDDTPYDTLNCLKCCFCYRGIHKECVLDTSLAHICSRCIESSSKKTLDFEENELSTVRFTVTKNLKCTIFVASIFVSCIILSRSSQLQAVHKNAGGC